MKQIRIKYLLALGIASLLAACQEDKYELSIPESDIRLTMPADGTSLNLNDKDVTSVTFSWDKSYENGNTIIFSSSPYLVGDTVQVLVGTVNEYLMDVQDLDVCAASLGVGGGKSGTVYWSVKPTDKLSVAASEIHSLTLSRIQTSLLTPEDQSVRTLDADTPDDNITFSWKTENESSGESYQLCFSMDSRMSGTVAKTEVGNTGEYSLTQQQIQNLIIQLPIALFSQNTIYWNVIRKSDGTLVSRTSHVLKLTGMLLFTDVRGDESITYRVAKVTYSTGQEVIWLAENLRTTKYPDGTELSLANGEYWNAPTNLSEDLQKANGKYYSLGIVGKIAPDGWKVPSIADYEELLAEALSSDGGANSIRHQTYWNWGSASQESANAWGIGLVPAGCVAWAGADATVGNNNTNDNNCYLLASDLSNKVALFSDWGMNNDKKVYSSGCWGGAPVRLIYVGK